MTQTTHTVLVPLDGSDKDDRALPAAAALADLAGGNLHLIRVLDVPVDRLSARARRYGVADAAREMRRELERNVKKVADRLVADLGRPVTTEVAESFDVAGVLVDRAGRREVDVVVMGTRAPGTVDRMLRGSVADRVMRESPRPVLLVPPRPADIAEQPLEMRRVLVPLDGSELSQSAIEFLRGLKRWSDLEYVLLEVVTSGFPPVPVAPGPLELTSDPLSAEAYADRPQVREARVKAQQRLSNVGDRLRSAGARDVRTRVAVSADPAGAIIRAARDEEADFIAMTTRGAGGLKRLALGSVAQALVRHAHLPVLLVTPASQ
jgi:nucleotide-binding universal stress UspA family protein